jgi:hypothetical protein
MRLKVPPVGVVPPAHRDEPFLLGEARNDRPPGGPQPRVGSEASFLSFPGSPPQPS